MAKYKAIPFYTETSGDKEVIYVYNFDLQKVEILRSYKHKPYLGSSGKMDFISEPQYVKISYWNRDPVYAFISPAINNKNKLIVVDQLIDGIVCITIQNGVINRIKFTNEQAQEALDSNLLNGIQIYNGCIKVNSNIKESHFK